MTFQKLLKALGFLLFNVLVVALIGEAAARALDLETRLLIPLLYYQEADLAVHEAVDDPELLYSLKPGAVGRFPDGYVREGEPRVVSVNSLGCRGPERSAEKAPGVFRVIVLGSSNAYGARVQDDETFPARLEALLAQRGDGWRYEVWNASTNGHKLSQLVRRADALVACCEPDLLLFQVYMFGRRPFLAGNADPERDSWDGLDVSAIQATLRANPELIAENLSVPPLPEGAWRPLFEASALLRALRMAAQHIDYEPPTRCCDEDHARFHRFTERHGAALPIYVMGISPETPVDPALVAPEYQVRGQLFPNPLPPPTDSPFFHETHPPGFVYRWYALEVLASLEAHQALPSAPPPQPERSRP